MSVLLSMGQVNLSQYQMRESDRSLPEEMVSAAQVQELFERLQEVTQLGDEKETTLLRDHLVVLHGALVEHCARGFTSSNEPVEDLVQEGYVGLIKAVDRFDPAQGVRFSTYACHLINGEIRHYLRDLGRLIHEPGWHFELRGRVVKTQEELVQRMGREATAQEIASALNIEEKTVQDVLRNQQTLAVEFPDQNAYDNEEETSWERKIAAPTESSHLQVENQLVLDEVFPHLKEVEKKALMMHFFQDFSKTEVARHLGISINHASYILKRGLETLRRMIEASEEIKLPPSPQARARAAFILGRVQKAAGVKDHRVPDAEHSLPPVALVPGVLRFVDIIEMIDERLSADGETRSPRTPPEESAETTAESTTEETAEEPFSVLWLRISGWENLVADYDLALRREISSAIQILTRKCCRSSDYVSMLTSPNWPGLHFVIYLPNTGSSGSRVGKRWEERCQEATFWPEGVEKVRLDYAYALFPRDGRLTGELFERLGRHFQRR